MSTTDILSRNIAGLPALEGIDHRTWFELERNSSSSYRESADGLRYSWLSLSANDFIAQGGAQLTRITRYPYVIFPNSTASGDPAAYMHVYPVRLKSAAAINLVRYWTFTTAAATTSFASMTLSIDWPNGNSFDVSSGSTDAYSETTLVKGSSSIDGLSRASDVIDNDFRVGAGWSYLTVKLNRNTSAAGDDLSLGLNVLLVQLQLATTST